MNRMVHAVRYELTVNRRDLIRTALGPAAAALVIGVVAMVLAEQVLRLWTWLPLMALITAVVNASGAFGELADPGRRIALLLRPVRPLETVVAKIVVTWAVALVALVAAFAAAELVNRGVGFLFGLSPQVPALDEVDTGAVILDSVYVTMILHAIFFFGASLFPKRPGLATAAGLTAWIASYILVAIVAVRLIFAPYIDGRHRGQTIWGGFDPAELFPWILNGPPEWVLWTTGVALALLLWGLTVRRLTELEA